MSALYALYAAIAAVVLVAVVRSFFVRRHGESVTPADGWQRTDEQFVDPTTGRRMRVWIDPVDGERHYVVDR